jgi:hypothetical protein
LLLHLLTKYEPTIQQFSTLANILYFTVTLPICFKFVKPKQCSNLTPNPITIVVNISAKSKTNPNLQNPITTLVSKTADFIFKSKFCKETTSLHPKKIRYIPNFFQTSNKFSYPFHQLGDIISHKKYSTIKQIPKRKSFLVWTNVKGIGQIQNPKFPKFKFSCNGKELPSTYLNLENHIKFLLRQTSITSHCHIPKLCPNFSTSWNSKFFSKH